MAHLNARQLEEALDAIDRQIMRMEYILADFDTFAVPHICPDGVPDYIGDAWNAAHDALAALREHRARVEMNPRPIPPEEYGTYLLVQQNID